MLLQIASILTCIVATSAATFSYHCMKLQLDAAAIHPPIMFCLLIILLIVPIDAVYKASQCSSEPALEQVHVLSTATCLNATK